MRKIKREKIFAVNSRQIQSIDKKAASDFGVSTLFLMENAGKAVAYESLKFLKTIKKSRNPLRVNIFCGKGNNGGDGFVCARYLINHGIKVKVFLFSQNFNLKGGALINFNRLKILQPQICEIPDLKSLKKFRKDFLNCDLIIDALFGVGLKGFLKEPFFSLIQFLNKFEVPIFSVDVPSGLDATTGKIQGAAMKAAKTITFTLPKIGFFRGMGKLYCGKIIVKKIGIPKQLINEICKHR